MPLLQYTIVGRAVEIPAAVVGAAVSSRGINMSGAWYRYSPGNLLVHRPRADTVHSIASVCVSVAAG